MAKNSTSKPTVKTEAAAADAAETTSGASETKHADTDVTTSLQPKKYAVDYGKKFTGLVVRKKPGGEKVATLTNGDVVVVIEEKGGWGRTKDGWVKMEFLAEVSK